MSEQPQESAGSTPEPAGDATGTAGEAPPVAVEPPEVVTDPPPAEPVGPLEATPMPAEQAVIPEPPKGMQGKRYTGRILLVYGLLLAAFGGAIAGVVVATTGGGGGGGSSTKGWSDWRPDNGTTAAMTKQIADHVQREYKLNKKGQQLLAVVSEPPRVTIGTHKVAISNIAIRTSPNGKAIKVVPTSGMWADEFCGIGAQCSIASGQPTEMRGRLVRREALEVALYTFKYVPAVKSVIAFMPPPAGQSPSTMLFLQKQDLQAQLDQPLRKTLPLTTPPLPTEQNPKEQATIDRLTLPSFYKYKLQQLQDASVLVVLDHVPVPS